MEIDALPLHARRWPNGTLQGLSAPRLRTPDHRQLARFGVDRFRDDPRRPFELMHVRVIAMLVPLSHTESHSSN
jgi:hypothetical protein